MSKIQLKIAPEIVSSLAFVLNPQVSGWFSVDKEIGEKTTIGDLLTDVASDCTEFRELVFNPDIGKVSDEVIVVLNNSVLCLQDVTETKLNDGDRVILLPVYSGG